PRRTRRRACSSLPCGCCLCPASARPPFESIDRYHGPDATLSPPLLSSVHLNTQSSLRKGPSDPPSMEPAAACRTAAAGSRGWFEDASAQLYQANATAFAPATTSSTTFAAPTIVAPLTTWSSVIPRGLVQAPHSQTCPPLSMNSEYRSANTGSPSYAIPLAPPWVPNQTASIVQ